MGNSAPRGTTLDPVAQGRQAVYERLVLALHSALRTQLDSVVEGALVDLFVALCDDTCAVTYDGSDSHRRGPPDAQVFARQLMVRALVFEGSHHGVDNYHQGTGRGGGGGGGGATQSNFLGVVDACLLPTRYGPRSKLLLVLIVLVLLGYDTNCGDILGLTAVPTHAALALARPVVTAWKAAQRGLGRTSVLKPGFPAIYVPAFAAEGELTGSTRRHLGASLRRQSFAHRRLIATETDALQMVVDALFASDTDQTLKLMCVGFGGSVFESEECGCGPS
jgi:hypothetical protein